MASPTANHPYDRPSIGEISFRLSPTPAENYRCPVSTPSNCIQRHSRIRRTKPMAEVIYPKPPTTANNGRQQRSKGMALTRHSRNERAVPRPQLQVGNSLKYYFVDRQGDQKEDEHVNTHWLKALCSQPVNEILNKYRRKSDVKRTRIIWCKTFTTPGEKSLLSAWENNMFQTENRAGRYIKSAYYGTHRAGESPSRQVRLTQSEPPLSRAQNMDLHSGSTSPMSSRKDMKSPTDNTMDQGKLDSTESVKDVSPRRKIPELLRDDPSSRVNSYVTQYFAPKGKGPMYAKVIKSPDLLPKLSSQQKIANMNKDRYNVSVPQLAMTPEKDESTVQI